ncbi:MAG: MFS transporter [Planctomycetaceae bacterium]
MYLSEHKTLRMFTLCLLYVAQGIPWGFVTVTFAAWLATPEHGISTDQLGKILAVASLPWSFKFLWGPLMDRFTIPSLGRRRPWIIFAQGMAILVLASLLAVDDLAGMVWAGTANAGPVWRTLYELIPGPLAAVILLANVFMSMQDVAVDALAVDLLQEKERGIANGLMYGSSYAGTAIGGAGLGYVVANYGIQAGLLTQALLLFVIMLLPLCVRERPQSAGTRLAGGRLMGTHSSGNGQGDPPDQREVDRGAPDRIDFGETPTLHLQTDPMPTQPMPTSGSASQKQSPASAAGTPETNDGLRPLSSESVLRNLIRAFSLRSTILGAGVAIGVKIGIGVLTAVLVDFLIKDGGWTQQQYTSVTGGWALLLGLSGAAMGGFASDRFGARLLIFTVSVLIGTLWIAFGFLETLIDRHSFVVVLLLGQEFLLAMLSVSLFSLFMTISWPRVAATQFTAYMSLMNLSTTIGSYLAGQLSASMTIHQILLVSGVLQILLVIPVLLIDTQQARRTLPSE